MKKIAIAIVAALALAGCATAPTATLKSLTEANNLVSDAAGQFHNAYVLGLVSKDQAKTEAAWVDASAVYSRNAQCAFAAGDMTTVTGAITSIMAFATAIVAEKDGKPIPTLPTLPNPLSCANAAPAATVIVP